ncbi:receptor kinase-like protein Xa21 [Cornus florida]|uniref:receptor kinase-like protein Xa21 n=1 Tax=Cornus florida TaxID=4283 RepID=UPI002898E39B|nr:receptor kinase-like protein Xa21 [Cornus florida]
MDCCEWSGVTCDNMGRVIGLDLSDESISGGIHNSSSLFNLKYLQSLNLAKNSFGSWQISSGFEKLTSLTYMNLSYADLTGQFPIGISGLTRSVSLDFSGNYYLKLGNSNLKLLVQNLTELTELRLDGVNISSKGEEWCQAISSSLPNLRVLSFSSCDLSGPLCSSLENLRSLSVIDLSQNNLSAPVPNFFANFTNLTELLLWYSNLQGTFPENIFHVPTLHKLDLSDNILLQGSFPEFFQNGSLQTLILSHTNFSGILPNSIGNLQMLSTIDVQNCNLTGAIPSSMANLTQLVYLDLSYNMFIGPTPSFSKNLSYIDLSHNHLTGTVPSTHFEGLLNLVMINLSQNSLNGSIPSSLLELPSLKKIYLEFNQFDGQVDEFSNASSSLLEVINLSSNNLQGATSLGNLKKLESLDLSRNKLTGMIPTQLASLTFLSVLNVSYNLLVGRIPTGSQFQTFSEASFLGNPGLCGFALNTSCSDSKVAPNFEDGHSTSESEVYLSAALGFIVGLGIIIWPLVFCRRWRRWYYKHVDRVFLRRIIQRRVYRNSIRQL